MAEGKEAALESQPANLPNLTMLVDVYKHAWDLYFKAMAFYLLACSVIASFAVSATAALYQKLFAGGAIGVGSLIAIYGFRLGTQYFTVISQKITRLCEKLEYDPPPFEPMRRFTVAAQCVAGVLAVTGFLYLSHVLAVEGGIGQLRKDLIERYSK